MSTVGLQIHLTGSALLIGTAVLGQTAPASAAAFFTALAALIAAIPC